MTPCRALHHLLVAATIGLASVATLSATASAPLSIGVVVVRACAVATTGVDAVSAVMQVQCASSAPVALRVTDATGDTLRRGDEPIALRTPHADPIHALPVLTVNF